MIKKLVLFPLLLLAFFAGQAWSAVDVYFNPGMAFYGDSVGYAVFTGAKLPLNEFGLPLNFLTGGTLYFSGAGTAKSSVFVIGGGADIGYRFSFTVKGRKIDVDPMLGLGMTYEGFQATSGGSVANMGFLILPRVDVVYQITPLFGMGLNTGYHASLYPTHAIANFYLGMNFNFRIGGKSVKKMKSKIKVTKKNKEVKKEVSKPKGTPEIAVYIDDKELVNGKGKIDFGMLLTNDVTVETNIVISNLGKAPLKLNGFSVAGEGLSLKGTEITSLGAGDGVSVTISMNSANALKNDNVKLTILSDDEDESESVFFVSGVVSTEEISDLSESTSNTQQTNEGGQK